VSKGLKLAAGLGLFLIVATANAGGYRFGASDQAFYAPAVALLVTPTLFPRDRDVLAPQMHVWVGGDLLAAATRMAGGDMPVVFLIVYLLTLVALGCAAVAFARALGASWWVTAGFLALLTLRHRISRTGANSLEGYMHPRMLAFALGLASFAAIAKRRFALGLAAIVAAGVIHPTTALWFGGVWIVALAVTRGLVRPLLAGAGVALAAALVVAATPATFHLDVMDADWLAVLAGKDYLFSTEWPIYAWATNLGYLAVVMLVHRRRQHLGLTAPGEAALVAGAGALVAVFLITLPLTVAHVSLAVQLQINRVFWLLDVLAAWSIAWWLVADVGARRATRGAAVAVTLLAVLAIGRGYYVLALEAHRPLFQVRLADSGWVDAMAFLRTQPEYWHVLADPEHGWKYGVSVRVAANRDVLLEAGKDSSMSMYDRGVAGRVAERTAALAAFGSFQTDDVRRLANRYELDVFVDRADRTMSLPVLYRNADFVVYALR
jgi:hypothetical protein